MAKREDKAEGESPKRKRGRPKGYPKTGGRKPNVTYATRSEVAGHMLPKWARLASDIIDGVPIRVAGHTGKPHTRIATMDEKISTLRMIGNKVMADLQSTAIKADVTTETTYTKPTDIRDVSRAVLNIFQAAKLEEAKHAPPPPPPPAQLLIERDKIIDVTPAPFAGKPATAVAPAGPLGEQPSPADPGGDGSQCSTASPSGSVAPLSSIAPHARAFSPYSRDAKPPSDPGEAGSASGNGDISSPGVSPSSRKPRHADKVEVDSNSSHIWFNGESKRWAVLDSDNVLHGWKRDRAEALAHAERLPRGAGPWQAHPFEPQDMGSGWHERRDNRATISNGKLNVVRRMPRGAR